MNKLLLTVREAAEELGLGRTKVYQLVMTRRLPSVRIDGSRRIPRTALERFVANLEQDAGE